MRLLITVPEGEIVPWYLGLAYVDWRMRDGNRFTVIPLNWFIRTGWSIWYRLRFPKHGGLNNTELYGHLRNARREIAMKEELIASYVVKHKAMVTDIQRLHTSLTLAKDELMRRPPREAD